MESKLRDAELIRNAKNNEIANLKEKYKLIENTHEEK